MAQPCVWGFPNVSIHGSFLWRWSSPENTLPPTSCLEDTGWAGGVKGWRGAAAGGVQKVLSLGTVFPSASPSLHPPLILMSLPLDLSSPNFSREQTFLPGWGLCSHLAAQDGEDLGAHVLFNRLAPNLSLNPDPGC